MPCSYASAFRLRMLVGTLDNFTATQGHGVCAGSTRAGRAAPEASHIQAQPEPLRQHAGEGGGPPARQGGGSGRGIAQRRW